MDVRCERCGTEYEFEDERVTEEGVTVKCSTCGHLFKIRKKSFVLTEPVLLGKKEGGDVGRNWMVRKSDGTVLSFKELTTLQKWIVERKVSRSDEISKSGESWKRLGEITELASFFQVVDQALAAAAPPDNQVTGTSPTQPLPAAAPATGRTQQLPAATVPSSAPAAAPTPAPAAPTTVPPAVAAPPVQEATPAAQPLSSGEPALSAEQAFLGGRQLEPDSWGDDTAGNDDDVIEKWKRRSRRKWYFLVPLLLVIIGLGGWYLAAPGPFMDTVNKLLGRGREIPPEVSQAYRQGMAALKGDNQEDFTTAARLFDDAIRKMDGKYPQALAALSLLHTERADHSQAEIAALDEQIAELQKQEDELKPADGSEPKGELFDKIAAVHNRKVELQKQRLKLVDQARKELEEAKRLVDDARRLDAKRVETAVALADYYRVMSGERAHVEKALQPARRQAPTNPWLLYVDGASLAGLPGQDQAATERLRRALVADAGLVAARLKLARLLLTRKQPDAARAELQNILAQHPSHRAARALLATLEKKPAAAAKEKKPETPAASAEPTTYEGWLKLASGQFDKGATRKALGLYDRALKLRPDGGAALAGKGWCYLDAGSNAAAVLWFGKALKADPRNAAALMGMAEAQKYQGNKKKARHYYQRYLELHPNGPDAAVARRNLKEL